MKFGHKVLPYGPIIHTPFIPFSPMVPSCKAMGQCYTQEIDIAVIYEAYSDLILFSCTQCVSVGMCVHTCVFSSCILMTFIGLCIHHHGRRTFPFATKISHTAFYNHPHLSPTFTMTKPWQPLLCSPSL